MREQIPPENTPEYVDYLLESLEAEVRLSERSGYASVSIDFYKGLIQAAFQWAFERLERQDKDHERIRTETN